MLALCFLPAISVFAAEEQGYLIKLKQTAAVAVEHDDGYVLDQLQYAPQYCRVASLEEVEAYIGMENVESIEPRCSLELFDMPNDTYYDAQWSYTALQTEYARLTGLDGEGIKIAVIDSGIYREHEEFAGVDIADGRNFARVSATNQKVDANDLTDYVGHGTAVTGVIAASTDNGLGICGIAPGVTIVPFRCFSATEGFDDWAAEAIYAAVDEYDCDIINMSFGAKIYTEAFYEAVRYAYEKGVIIVAAVGNYGTDIEYYPAAFDEVIGVGAIGAYKEWWDYSQCNESVFVTAPGAQLITAEKTANNAYRMDREGTSFASPAVAAIAALALQVDDMLTPEEFRDLLKETAEDLGDPGYDVFYGHGLANTEALLKELQVSLQPVMAKKDGVQTEVSGFVEGFQPLEERNLILAGYQQDGKMIAVVTPGTYQADKIGVLDIRENLEAEFDLFTEIKLFWLNMDELFPVPASVPMQISIK